MTDSIPAIHDGASTRATVLVVEDEALVAFYLEDTLAALGYQCCGVADSAEQALSLAAARRPALALVDVGLRGSRDGIALASDLADLRSEEPTSELQSLMRNSYAVFCLKKKIHNTIY